MHLYLFTYKYHNAGTNIWMLRVLHIVLYYYKSMHMHTVKIIAITAKKNYLET